MNTVTLRPRDSDAIDSALRKMRSSSGLPVVFGGVCNGRTAQLTSMIGMRTPAMRGLEVEYGLGLGGRVIRSRRSAVVRDYVDCVEITDHYRDVVRHEALRTIVAVPVVVDDDTRAIVYGALRSAEGVGDRSVDAVSRIAGELAIELRVRDDVDRRLAMADIAAADAADGIAASDLEHLRGLYGELRAIAAELDDSTLRDRLLQAGSALVGVVGGGERAESAGPTASLTPREVDVLSQVALGCTNGETAKRLSLSAETVKGYLKSVSTKLDTNSRMESVARARLLGYLL